MCLNSLKTPSFTESYILFSYATQKYCNKFHSLKELRLYAKTHYLNPEDCIIIQCFGDNKWETKKILRLCDFAFQKESYSYSKVLGTNWTTFEWVWENA